MTKSKTGAPPRVLDPRAHPSHGFQGFRSAESKAWYDAYFHRRPVLKERSLNLQDLPIFIQNAYRSWAAYFQIEHEVNRQVVREFYSSLIPDPDSAQSLLAFVRGKRFTVTPHTLAQFMEVHESTEAEAPWRPTQLPPASIVYASLTGQQRPWNGKQLLATSLTKEYGELNVIFRQTLFLTTHSSDFGHYYAAHLVAVGTQDPFSLPRFFFDIMYATAASTSARGSLPYGGLITRFCYDRGVRPRPGDTFLPVEEPLSAASLAKRDGALLGSVAKRRHIVLEDDPIPELDPAAGEGDEQGQAVERGAEQQPPDVQGIGRAYSSAPAVPSAPAVLSRADLAHLERLIMETRVEIAALRGQVAELTAQFDSYRTSSELAVALQLQREEAAMAREQARHRDLLEAISRSVRASSSRPP